MRRLLQEMRRLEREAYKLDPKGASRDARDKLAAARARQKEAEDLGMEEFMSVPLRQQAYQPCGDLWIDFEGKAMICGIHTAGSVIGAAEAVLGQPSPTAAITVVPTSTSRLCVAEFRRLVTEDLAFSAAVLQAVSRDAHEATREAITLGSYPAQVRLQRLLSQLASNSSPVRKVGRLRLSLPVKQYELAELLAVTPAYLCRLLGRLEREGKIKREKGWILLPQPARAPL